MTDQRIAELRAKPILKWAQQEECSRPMTSDFLNSVFKIQ